MFKQFALAATLAAASLAVQAKDIVDTAVAAGNFKTLATALQAAGLVETLKGKGPFTVFAPTDAAFAKIPKADLDALLKDKAKLTAVLTYHVVAGKVMAKDVKAGEVKTVQGGSLTLATTGGVTVNNAKVVQADIVASNGVIHVIDTVVLPPENIVATAAKAGKFQTLLTAATAAGLADTLANGGPFTVFAPTDEAFAKLGKDTIADLLKPENKDKLANVLKYHVVAGVVKAADVVKLKEAKTLQGGAATVKVVDGKVTIDGANVVATDIAASNGVIHVIDAVILPR
jgi:transforming growth factor-beta-induced protein